MIILKENDKSSGTKHFWKFPKKKLQRKNSINSFYFVCFQLQNSLFANSTQDQRQNLQIIPLYKSFDYAKLQNQTVIVSGFGITEPNATTPSVIRKYLEAKITKERNCPKLDSIVCVFSQNLGFHVAQGFCHVSIKTSIFPFVKKKKKLIERSIF